MLSADLLNNLSETLDINNESIRQASLNFQIQNTDENCDIFLACCDWEAAAQAEREDKESSDGEDTVVSQFSKQCKRKSKL